MPTLPRLVLLGMCVTIGAMPAAANTGISFAVEAGLPASASYSGIVAYPTNLLDLDAARIVFAAIPSTSSEDVDAAHVLPTGNIVLSVTTVTNDLGGLATIEAGDLIEFDPTTGVATLVFSASLFVDAENIDAFSILPSGNWLLSTATAAALPAAGGGDLAFGDSDLVEWDPVAGTASLFLDEATLFTGVVQSNPNIDALHVLGNGNILLSLATDGIGRIGSNLEYQIADEPSTDVFEYNPTSGTASLRINGDGLFEAPSGARNINAVFEVVEPPPPSDFTIAVFGDTQTYANDPAMTPILANMVDWVLANADALDIELVLQVGDLIHAGTGDAVTPATTDDWSRFNGEWKRLDGQIPYAVVRGNHDNSQEFRDHYGPVPLSAFPHYLETHPGEDDDAHAWRLALGGQQALVVGVSCNPSQSELDWASGVLDAHPALPAIVLSHIITGPAGAHPISASYDAACSGNPVKSVWLDLVKPHAEQVFMTASGHVLGGNGFKGVRSVGDDQVFETFQNWQGGASSMGCMTLVHVRPSLDEVEAQAWCTELNGGAGGFRVEEAVTSLSPQIHPFRIGDQDADGWLDTFDNCRSRFNPNQEDDDVDGIGSACELFSVDFAAPADGLLTEDSETGIQWLDPTDSAGLSYEQVEAELGPTGNFAGFTFATEPQLTTLFTHAGTPWVNTPAHADNLQPVMTLQAMVGTTAPDSSTAYYDDGDPAGGVGSGELLISGGGLEASASTIPDAHSSTNVDPGIGSWLILDPVFTSLDAGSLVLSSTGAPTLGGLAFSNKDLVQYDGVADVAVPYFDGSVLQGNVILDAAHVMPDGSVILSTRFDSTVAGLPFRDGDLVRYDPVADTAEIFLSEDLFAGDTDIDAVSVLDDGHIVLSMLFPGSLGGVSFQGGDLVEYDPLAGTASLFLSQSVFTSGPANINALRVIDGITVLVSVEGVGETLGGVSFSAGEVVEYSIVADQAVKVLEDTRFLVPTSANVDAVWLPSQQVPEPGAVAQLVSGILGLCGLARWRSRGRERTPERVELRPKLTSRAAPNKMDRMRPLLADHEISRTNISRSRNSRSQRPQLT